LGCVSWDVSLGMYLLGCTSTDLPSRDMPPLSVKRHSSAGYPLGIPP
jgi:hypothetical protein